MYLRMTWARTLRDTDCVLSHLNFHLQKEQKINVHEQSLNDVHEHFQRGIRLAIGKMVKSERS